MALISDNVSSTNAKEFEGQLTKEGTYVSTYVCIYVCMCVSSIHIIFYVFVHMCVYVCMCVMVVTQALMY